MKELMIITCAFLLLGCGTLNKDKLFSKNLTKEVHIEESTKTLAVQQAINIRDSNTNILELTIWPKGAFSFSQAKGFVGEAFKMELKGGQSQLIQSSALLTSKSELAKKRRSQKEILVKLKEKKVDWEGMEHSVWLMVLVVAVGVWLMRKR
ncbi:hypothetical protein [Pedobacter frigiditerrae]|uniref:hypothetical protein n=1 Tax=Pedobacter frigiditerrae TaxID=2530452 RepID=UPI00292D0B36|nr:hypothetical protein [Pedobacter frigiditerrae]